MVQGLPSLPLSPSLSSRHRKCHENKSRSYFRCFSSCENEHYLVFVTCFVLRTWKLNWWKKDGLGHVQGRRLDKSVSAWKLSSIWAVVISLGVHANCLLLDRDLTSGWRNVHVIVNLMSGLCLNDILKCCSCPRFRTFCLRIWCPKIWNWKYPTYIYWTVHHLDSWIKIDQLMSFALFFAARHVSNASTFIFRSLRLCVCIPLWFDVCWRYGVVRLG